MLKTPLTPATLPPAKPGGEGKIRVRARWRPVEDPEKLVTPDGDTLPRLKSTNSISTLKQQVPSDARCSSQSVRVASTHADRTPCRSVPLHFSTQAMQKNRRTFTSNATTARRNFGSTLFAWNAAAA